MKTFLLFITQISLFAYSQNVLHPIPNNSHPITINVIDNSITGHYLTSPFTLPSGPGISINSQLYILDKDGYLEWYLPNSPTILGDFKYDELTNTYSAISRNDSLGFGFIFDSNLNINRYHL